MRLFYWFKQTGEQFCFVFFLSAIKFNLSVGGEEKKSIIFQILRGYNLHDHVTKFLFVMIVMACVWEGVFFCVLDKQTTSFLSPSLSRSSAGRWGSHSHVFVSVDVFREIPWFFRIPVGAFVGVVVSLNRLPKCLHRLYLSREQTEANLTDGQTWGCCVACHFGLIRKSGVCVCTYVFEYPSKLSIRLNSLR